MPPGSSSDRAGAAGLKRLLESRGVMPTDYDDWRKIEETEIGRRPPGLARARSSSGTSDWLRDARPLIAPACCLLDEPPSI